MAGGEPGGGESEQHLLNPFFNNLITKLLGRLSVKSKQVTLNVNLQNSH